MDVWPFAPRNELIEILQWNTDVIRTKNQEQRFAQRDTPLYKFNLTHYLSEPEYIRAQALIRNNEDLFIPDWPLLVNHDDISGGADQVILFGQEDSRLDIGDSLLLWENSSKYEICTIKDSDSADSFVVDVSASFSTPKIIPLRVGRSRDGFTGTRVAGNILSGSITFDIDEYLDISANTYPIYEGAPLIDDCPIIAAESFSEPISHPVQVFSSGIGQDVYVTQRNFYDFQKTMRWHVFTRSELYQLRQFLYAQRGRQRAFWFSSHSYDFELAVAAGASDTDFLVFAPLGQTDIGLSALNIEINGTLHKQVTNIQSTLALGKPALRFYLSEAIGESIGIGAKISQLHLMRFNSDRVELLHQANAGVSVSIPVIELNEL